MTWANMKQKSIKVPGKRPVAQKPKRAVRRTLHTSNTPRFTYLIRFFFSET